MAKKNSRTQDSLKPEQSKPCMSCGRIFSIRKKWQHCWDQVKYCSDTCRKKRQHDLTALQTSLLDLLETRGPNKSICPSEILSAEDKKNKVKMERVRQAARLLCYQQKIEILQKGRPVDPTEFKGPIRLQKKR